MKHILSAAVNRLSFSVTAAPDELDKIVDVLLQAKLRVMQVQQELNFVRTLRSKLETSYLSAYKHGERMTFTSPTLTPERTQRFFESFGAVFKVLPNKSMTYASKAVVFKLQTNIYIKKLKQGVEFGFEDYRLVKG